MREEQTSILNSKIKERDTGQRKGIPGNNTSHKTSIAI
jgi:hypothetical protein